MLSLHARRRRARDPRRQTTSLAGKRRSRDAGASWSPDGQQAPRHRPAPARSLPHSPQSGGHVGVGARSPYGTRPALTRGGGETAGCTRQSGRETSASSASSGVVSRPRRTASTRAAVSAPTRQLLLVQGSDASNATKLLARSPGSRLPAAVESPGGISPPGARRSRREPLDSPGSCHPAVGRAIPQWANRPRSRSAIAARNRAARVG
jgi:hypothetical protein